MRTLPRLCILLLFVCFFLGCKDRPRTITVSFESSPKLEVEVAHTPGARQLGLMYRKELPENGGMLFIFPDEAERGFWMKNTYLELDIIFMNRDFEVTGVIHKAVPQSMMMRKSPAPSMYALEVLGGKAAEWGITPGARFSISAPLPTPE